MSNQLLKTDLFDVPFMQQNWAEYSAPVAAIHHHLETTEEELVGWLHSPLQNQDELLCAIHRVADEIKTHADVLVVIGVGGSFLGAKAIQEALTPYFGTPQNGLEIVYVGQNMSGTYVNQLIASLTHRDVYVNVISKSGATMEPALAFRALRNYMHKRYGSDASQRIVVTTDNQRGLLKTIAEYAGYRQFTIPSNVGGRYSVLTAVGLLPLAVAGVEIEQLLNGAKSAATALKEESLEKNEAYRYAVMRHLLYKQGYQIELLATLEPNLAHLQAWWTQLFAESEGKCKQGLYPSHAQFPADLHSIGQFIQEGNPILFETVLHVTTMQVDYIIPYDMKNEDGLNYLAGQSLHELATISKQGIVAAHQEANVPIIQLELAKLDAYHIGYLVYFFMKACAMSACLLHVNPFDQPGVEAYKSKIQALLREKFMYQELLI